MKAHFFDPNDPIFIVGLLATFKLAWYSSHVHESSAMWFLPVFVRNTLATTLYSCMSAATQTAPVVASVITAEPTTQKKYLVLSGGSYLLILEVRKRSGNRQNGLHNSALHRTSQYQPHAIRWRLVRQVVQGGWRLELVNI